MPSPTEGGRALLCPSAPADLPSSAAFAVVHEQAGGEGRLRYAARPVPVADLPPGARPHVPELRIAATCAETSCAHFAAGRCGLASRLVARLAPVVERMPPCPIRRDCRWFAEEGRSACLRCPQVATVVLEPTPEVAAVASPPGTARVARSDNHP